MLLSLCKNPECVNVLNETYFYFGTVYYAVQGGSILIWVRR